MITAPGKERIHPQRRPRYRHRRVGDQCGDQAEPHDPPFPQHRHSIFLAIQEEIENEEISQKEQLDGQDNRQYRAIGKDHDVKSHGL